MQQGLDCGGRFPFPESGVLPDVRGKGLRWRVLWRGSSPSTGPGSPEPVTSASRRKSWRELLRIEDRDRTDTLLAFNVAVRLSGLVDVVITAPGASRIALMTMWRPLPERGGPMSRMLSSTVAHTCPPLPVPRRYPTSAGLTFPVSEGRSVLAFLTSAFPDATWMTSLAAAVPARRCGSTSIVRGAGRPATRKTLPFRESRGTGRRGASTGRG